MADRRTRIILGLDAGPYIRGLASASSATKAFVKDLDSSDSRMGNLVQTSLALGPALVPIGATAVPAVAALTAGLGAAAGAAGVAALAFNGVGDGLKALNDYQLEPSAKNLEKVRQAFEDIGPAGADFVMFLDELEPKLDKLQNAARAGLLPGVEEGIRSLMDRAPQVTRIIGEISGALGDLAAEAGDGLASDKFDDFFDYIEREARPILTDMGRTLGNVTEGLANMLVEFDPLSDMFSRGLLGMSRDFAKWSRGLEDNEGFQSFVDYVQRVSPKAMDTLGAIALALADIVEAAAPVGEVSLPIIKAIAQVLGAVAESPAGPVLIAAAAGLSAVSRSIAVFNAANGSALLSTLRGSEKAGKGLSRVFSPTGALVGGIGVLALSLTDLDEKAGLSNAAMGAMLGAVAGPWGAAIGGGIGLVKDFAAANDDLEDATKRVNSIMGGTDASGIVASLSAQQKGAAEAADNYGALDKSINFVSDGLRGAGPLGLAMGEQLRFLSDEATNTGAGIRTLVSSVTAFTNLRRFDAALGGDALRTYGKDASELEASLTKAAPVLKRFGYTVEDVLSGNLSDSEMRQLAAATRHYLRTIDSAPGRTKAMGKALKDLNDPMATASESASALATALDAVFAPALSAQEAMLARIESLDALSAQLRKTNGQFNLSTKATRESRGAIVSHVGAIVDEAKAMAERGDGTRKVSKYLREQRRDLIDVMVQSGASRKEARRLVDVTLRYGEIIRGLPDKKTTKVETPGLPKSIEQFTTLFGWIKKTPDKKSTKTDAPGADKTTDQFKNLDGWVRTVADKKKVDTSAPGADKTRGQMQGLKGDIDRINGKTVDVKLSTNAAKIIDQTVDLIGDMLPFADGGVVEAYADGGMRENHIAQIARPGAMRVWAEPETGGEAYIPLAQSKRGRSLDIWQETGRRLGVEGFADGGVRVRGKQARPDPSKAVDAIDDTYTAIAAGVGRAASKMLSKAIESMNTGFHWPLPRRYGYSGSWGSYSSGGSHPALDFPAPTGTPIYSVLPGKVMHTTSLGDRSYGNYTEIKHGGGLSSLYAHQSAFRTKSGASVTGGETIGLVGSVGNSSGPHLHLEVKRNGTSFDYTQMLKSGATADGTGIYDGDHSGLDRASPSTAKAYARSILPKWGWPATQWPYWEDLGNRESGWRWNATNPSSGAYGIPQSLPASKMATSGSDWRTNVGTQLDWMAGYIKERYDGPHGAINWHDAHNWYADGGINLFDRGGTWRSGTLGANLSGDDETVLDPTNSRLFAEFVRAIKAVADTARTRTGPTVFGPDRPDFTGTGDDKLEGFVIGGGKPGKNKPEGIDFPEFIGLSDKEQAILDRAGEKFGIEGSMDRSEIRQEMNDLIGAVEEAFDGSGDSLVGALKKFKERALDTAKSLEKERAERDKLSDKLKATRQAANQYGNEVAGNFMNDPMTGGLDEFYLQLNADKNDSRKGKRLQKRAERLGLDGPLAKAILASGNIDLLAELVRGGRSEIRKAEQAFESRNKAANAFGDAAALHVYGERIDKQTKALSRQTEKVDRLTERLEGIEDRIGDRVERGARRGTRDRDKDKHNLLQQQVWEARG